MRNNSDAVIIGGGIIGLAVAFYLAKEKFGRIVLLEKEPLLGMGATSKAAGGIRAQFATKDNIKMSMLSEKLFNSFKEDTGAEVKFDKVGYLFILKTDNDVKTYKNNYELQLSLGLNVELLNPEGIRKIAPHISLEGVQLATYCPDDGLGDPHEFLSGYEHAARHLGVEIEFETEVTGIDLNSDKITAVKTTKGAINTPLVINCTGPFAKEIGKMIGVDIKVEPVRRQIVTTGELDFVQPTFPMVVDVQSGLYCHKESKGLLLGWADKSIRPSYDISVDPEYTDSILEKALNFIPQLADAEIANEWAGLYETTPDNQAIIGYEPSVSGIFHIVGFSGHGFMHAPAAGLITSEILTNKTPSIDISNFSPDRFTRGVTIEETYVI